MSLLISLDEADFLFIKEKTKATSGNISVQITKLEEARYIEVDKFIEGKKSRTVCRITQTGVTAFNEYVKVLQSYINPE